MIIEKSSFETIHSIVLIPTKNNTYTNICIVINKISSRIELCSAHVKKINYFTTTSLNYVNFYLYGMLFCHGPQLASCNLA